MAKSKKVRDPIGDYVDWTRNRYNPGYYLGGKLPPFIRGAQSLFSLREKRVFVVLLLVIVIAVCAWRFWPLLQGA
jgi:hypothetical protein